ncbi:hypothetical protein V8D89_014770 [Ganoderma adspersum]
MSDLTTVMTKDWSPLKGHQQVSLCLVHPIFLGRYLLDHGPALKDRWLELKKEARHMVVVVMYTFVRIHRPKHVEGSILDPAQARLVGVFNCEFKELAMGRRQVVGARPQEMVDVGEVEVGGGAITTLCAKKEHEVVYDMSICIVVGGVSGGVLGVDEGLNVYGELVRGILISVVPSVLGKMFNGVVIDVIHSVFRGTIRGILIELVLVDVVHSFLGDGGGHREMVVDAIVWCKRGLEVWWLSVENPTWSGSHMQAQNSSRSAQDDASGEPDQVGFP